MSTKVVHLETEGSWLGSPCNRPSETAPGWLNSPAYKACGHAAPFFPATSLHTHHLILLGGEAPVSLLKGLHGLGTLRSSFLIGLGIPWPLALALLSRLPSMSSPHSAYETLFTKCLVLARVPVGSTGLIAQVTCKVYEVEIGVGPPQGVMLSPVVLSSHSPFAKRATG